MTRFFIERPILSSVVAIIIMLAGALCIPILPITQYPDIVPPSVTVTSNFVGGNAEQVAENVTVPLENQINGVEGMIYVQSVSTNEGQSAITVTFEIGYDIDIATVDVQNRVQQAESQLPPAVIQYGIDVAQASPDIVLIIDIGSENGQHNLGFISNYASINIVNSLLRVDGVGSVTVFGERTYAMRLWLDPNKLAGYGLSATDVATAIKNQNQISPAGLVGSPPSPSDQTFMYIINSQSSLSEADQFSNIILKADDNGSIIRVRDVARTELGAQNYFTALQMDQKPSIGLAIYQLPGSNALDIAKDVRATMSELDKNFPSGMQWQIPYDTTTFIELSIDDVIDTLLIALVLVILVVYIFLQDLRTTIVPSVAIPVAIIGTFSLLMVLDFSINMLTLFGLVLAIGLVIDDAIVVIENITRLMEEGMPAKEASIKAMHEVVGPVFASTMVMMSVFIPSAFMPGITGQLYKQFALTIAFSLLFSLINAMTFTPALASVTLKPKTPGKKNNAFEKYLTKFFTWFNDKFDHFTEQYKSGVLYFIKHKKVVMSFFIAVILSTIALFFIVPSGFVPEEDQGWVLVDLELPAGSSLARTEKSINLATQMAQKIPGVLHTVAITGFDIISGAQSTSSGVIFIILKPFDERTSEELSAFSIINQLQKELMALQDVEIPIAMNAPPIPGLSSTGGFQYVLQDINNAGLDQLSNLTWAMVGDAKQRVKELGPLFSTFQVNVPTLVTEVDRDLVFSSGVSLSDLYANLQANLGSLYVNQFNKYDQVYQVYVQADQEYRNNITDISNQYVRNDKGDMLPMSDFVTVRETVGPGTITRYNLYNATIINGGPAKGYSSGIALNAMEDLSAQLLPGGFSYEWTGTAYQQVESGNAAPVVFTLSLIMVFLILAALYESWIQPIMIMLAVPTAIFGALIFQQARGLENDVYCQIALIMLIGLAAKNAILIVQFANDKRMTGASIIDSVVYACGTRLRPILMTAFAFILGVAPLVWATGASAASRHTLGTAVFGGMIVSTVLSLIFVPVIYFILETLREKYVDVLPEGVVDQQKAPPQKPVSPDKGNDSN